MSVKRGGLGFGLGLRPILSSLSTTTTTASTYTPKSSLYPNKRRITTFVNGRTSSTRPVIKLQLQTPSSLPSSSSTYTHIRTKIGAAAATATATGGEPSTLTRWYASSTASRGSSSRLNSSSTSGTSLPSSSSSGSASGNSSGSAGTGASGGNNGGGASTGSSSGAGKKKPSPHLVWYREIVPAMLPIIFISSTIFLTLTLLRTHLSHSLTLTENAARIEELEMQLARLRREQRIAREREKRERERILPLVVERVLQKVGVKAEDDELIIMEGQRHGAGVADERLVV